MVAKRILAIDGDGVVFDYRKAYPAVWRAAFGTDINMVRPDAYHAHTAYGIVWDSPEQEAHFFRHFGEAAWSAMPLMDEGVREGCELLVQANFELVCVSSMNPAFEASRRKNFELHDLPFAEVYAVKRDGTANPKKAILDKIRPEVLADDLLDNFRELSPDIHTAYIDYGRFDAPRPASPVVPMSVHGSFLDFARYWANRT